MKPYYNVRELMMLDLSTIASINLDQVAPRTVTPAVVTHFLRAAKAYWKHDGDISRPHAELTSGKCSDGFVDVLRLLRYTPVCQLFGRELALELYFLDKNHSRHQQAEWVVGSDHAGATISYSVAQRLKAIHDFTEKADAGRKKIQLWKRHEIPDGQAVLQVEELITTLSTLEAVRKGIRRGNSAPVEFVDAILTVVNRSGELNFEGSPILSLVEYNINVWEPDACPLCAQGSPRIKPKQNWEALTG